MIACYSWQQFSGTERNKAEVDSKTKQVPRSSILEMQNSCASPWLTFPSSFAEMMVSERWLDRQLIKGVFVGCSPPLVSWLHCPPEKVLVHHHTYSATKIRGQFIIICHYFLYSLFLPLLLPFLDPTFLPFTPLISLGVPYSLWTYPFLH